MREERGEEEVVEIKVKDKRGREKTRLCFQCNVLVILQSLNRCHVRLHHCRWRQEAYGTFHFTNTYSSTPRSQNQIKSGVQMQADMQTHHSIATVTTQVLDLDLNPV